MLLGTIKKKVDLFIKQYFPLIVEVWDDSRSVLKMDISKMRIGVTVEQFLQQKSMKIAVIF